MVFSPPPRNHVQKSPWFEEQVSLGDGQTAGSKNLVVPAGRKNVRLVALTSVYDGTLSSIKYGGSGGTNFTQRQSQSITTEIGTSRIYIHEYTDPEPGTVNLYVTKGQSESELAALFFVVRDAVYLSATGGTGTATSSSRTSTLTRGGWVIGGIIVGASLSGITPTGAAQELYDEQVDEMRRFRYQGWTGNGPSLACGGSWSGSSGYAHVQAAWGPAGSFAPV